MEQNSSHIEEQFSKKTEENNTRKSTVVYENNPFKIFMTTITKLFNLNQNAALWIIGLGFAPTFLNYILSPSRTVEPDSAVGAGVIVLILVIAIVFIALAFMMQAMAAYVGIKTAKSEKVSLNDSFVAVKKKIWKIVGLNVLVGLYVLAGCLLFIIPGIILAIRYSLSLVAMLDEDLSIKEAMNRSKQLTEKRLIETAALLFIGGFVPVINTLMQPAMLSEQFLQLRAYKDRGTELPVTHKYSKYVALVLPLIFLALFALFFAFVIALLISAAK